jgi:hypothetical protein
LQAEFVKLLCSNCKNPLVLLRDVLSDGIFLVFSNEFSILFQEGSQLRGILSLLNGT